MVKHTGIQVDGGTLIPGLQYVIWSLSGKNRFQLVISEIGTEYLSHFLQVNSQDLIFSLAFLDKSTRGFSAKASSTLSVGLRVGNSVAKNFKQRRVIVF